MPVKNELLSATCAHLTLCGMRTRRQRRWPAASCLNHSLAADQAACACLECWRDTTAAKHRCPAIRRRTWLTDRAFTLRVCLCLQASDADSDAESSDAAATSRQAKNLKRKAVSDRTILMLRMCCVWGQSGAH